MKKSLILAFALSFSFFSNTAESQSIFTRAMTDIDVPPGAQPTPNYWSATQGQTEATDNTRVDLSEDVVFERDVRTEQGASDEAKTATELLEAKKHQQSTFEAQSRLQDLREGEAHVQAVLKVADAPITPTPLPKTNCSEAIVMANENDQCTLKLVSLRCTTTVRGADGELVVLNVGEEFTCPFPTCGDVNSIIVGAELIRNCASYIEGTTDVGPDDVDHGTADQ